MGTRHVTWTGGEPGKAPTCGDKRHKEGGKQALGHEV